MAIYDLARRAILPLSKIDQFILSNAKVVDLGCGQGVLLTYLAHKHKRNLVGVDNDRERLPKQNAKNIKFELADIRRYNVSRSTAVIISDVLHHLNFRDQDNLLVKIAEKLKKGGQLVVKEIDTSEFLRSRMSRFWDFVFYPKDRIYYRNSKDFKRFLESLGFSVKISRPCRFFPGSTTLYLCQKN